MRITFPMRLVVGLALAATCAAGLAQQALSWQAVRGQLTSNWKQSYPNEKILKIERVGKVQYYSSERRTEMSQFWGWFWEERTIEVQGAFARQVAHVTVERADKTQALFEVAALFQKAGGNWQFRQIVSGKVTDLTAAKADDLPSKEEAARLFSEAWGKHRPDFEVHSVEVLGSEPKRHQERRWITYRLAITATGTDKGSKAMYGKKFRCTPADYSSVLKLESGKWQPDDSMIRNVNEDRDCSPAR